MTDTGVLRDGGTDDELLAELFDRLLQSVMDGETPDLDGLVPGRPDLLPRVRQAYELACSVAGRREPGRPVLGGYEILRELGRGGMGTVYLARHESLQREVAIKVLPQSLALSTRAKRRFLDEARSLARLRHANIVHIHRIVDHQEMLAFEMEYVEGPSLQSLLVDLRQHAPQPSREHLAAAIGVDPAQLHARSTVEYLVKLGIAVARALAEVHRRGLVHRDVKPSNILLRRDGTPVLADFGLARDGELQVTQTISFAGTPIYAAPERLRDGDLGLDGRADVYSLGVTLYEAITLTPPYQGRSTDEVLRKIEAGRMVPLRQRAPWVSKDLQTVLQKAMDPDPRHRFASAAEFADDLERLLTLQPILARPRSLLRRTSLLLRRQRKTLFGALAGALLVTAGLWPVFAATGAAAAARQRADHHARLARQMLLQPLCSDLAGGAFGHSVATRSRPSLSVDTGPLEAVLAEYDLACSNAPQDPVLQQERAAVAAAVWLRTSSPARQSEIPAALDSPGFRAATAKLGPVSRQALEQLLAGPIDVAALRPELAGARPTDRFALGLLAALSGEVAVCESCWAGLEESSFGHPLLDAGLGLLAQGDGFPERAYPRLFHARRTFPASRALAFELADAALSTGDHALAEAWLAKDDGGTDGGEVAPARRLRLAADLLAATGDEVSAEQRYRQILSQWPEDAVSRHRLASLAIERGDLNRARGHLWRLVAEWPDRVRAHLDLARLALHLGDRAGYLREARYAVARGLRRDESRGVTENLVEILRLGGLTGLAAEVGAADYTRSDWRHIDPPRPPWARAQDVPSVEACLRVLATFDRAESDARRRYSWRTLSAVRGAVVTAWRHPHLLRPLGFWGGAASVAAPFVVGQPLAQELASLLTMPFQDSLGTRLTWFSRATLIPRIDLANSRLSVSGMATLGVVDGTEELLVAVSPVGADGTGGRVQIHSGRDGTLQQVIDGPDQTIFGYSLCDLGDLDGDRIPDYAVGAPLRRLGERTDGLVIVYSGRSHEPLYRVEGRGIGFGVALANLGDLDDDGVADFAVGISPELLNRSASEPAAVLYSGATGTQLREFYGDRGGTWFGADLAVAGDVDRDGFDDLVIGGNNGGAPGVVRVVSARSGAVLVEIQDDGESSDFARRVLGVGDVDGDGVPDIAVGAPGIGSNAPRPGRVVVFSSRSGRRLSVLQGDDAGDWFGITMCRAANWRGDDRPALAIAATRQGITGSGYVRVFDVRSLRPIQSFYLPSSIMFGQAMACLGDWQGRGRPRLAASSFSTATRTGVVRDLTFDLDGR